MSDERYAQALRTLCGEYYKQHVSFAEYRERRKILLDAMDVEFNDVSRMESTGDKQPGGYFKCALGLMGLKTWIADKMRGNGV